MMKSVSGSRSGFNLGLGLEHWLHKTCWTTTAPLSCTQSISFRLISPGMSMTERGVCTECCMRTFPLAWCNVNEVLESDAIMMPHWALSPPTAVYKMLPQLCLSVPCWLPDNTDWMRLDVWIVGLFGWDAHMHARIHTAHCGVELCGGQLSRQLSIPHQQ